MSLFHTARALAAVSAEGPISTATVLVAPPYTVEIDLTVDEGKGHHRTPLAIKNKARIALGRWRTEEKEREGKPPELAFRPCVIPRGVDWRPEWMG